MLNMAVKKLKGKQEQTDSKTGESAGSIAMNISQFVLQAWKTLCNQTSLHDYDIINSRQHLAKQSRSYRQRHLFLMTKHQ